jgi:hypothetical protein
VIVTGVGVEGDVDELGRQVPLPADEGVVKVGADGTPLSS